MSCVNYPEAAFVLELVYCSLVSTDDCILLELVSNVFLGITSIPTVTALLL